MSNKKVLTLNPDTLMDENDEVNKVLVEIFMKFDVDKDGVLNTVELQKFASVTNGGEEFTADDLESIKETFHTRERDSALTMRGFLEMYQLQTLGEPEATIKDLKVHGFLAESD